MGVCEDGSVGDIDASSTTRMGTEESPGLGGRNIQENMEQEVAQIK